MASAMRVIRILLFLIASLGAVTILAGLLVGVFDPWRLDPEESTVFANRRTPDALLKSKHSNKPWTFLVLGDIQEGIGGLSRLMKSALTTDCLFIVQTGDLVASGLEGHYRMISSKLSSMARDLPVFVAPGNHDVGKDRGRHFERFVGPRYLSFMTNSSLFVILDNSPGRIDAGQMSWVKKTLASAADAEHIFLFMHQPIISWPQGPARRAEKRHRKLLRLIKENHVDAVFMGHWHGYHSESRDRVRFVVNGRGVDFDWNSWYSPVPAYATTVKVNGEKVAIGKIEIEGRLLPLFTGQLETFLFVYLHPLIVEHRLLSLLFLFGLAAAATILFLRMRRGPGSTSSQI